MHLFPVDFVDLILQMKICFVVSMYDFSPSFKRFGKLLVLCIVFFKIILFSIQEMPKFGNVAHLVRGG